MYNAFQNPYMPGNQYMQGYNAIMQQQQQPQQTQVVRVNGRNGAEAFSIGPNSSALLLDESGTLIWLVTSDGAGYKTVAPYDIAPHKDAPAPDYGNLESRIAKLEAMMNERTSADSSAVAGSKPDGGKHAAD